MLNEHTHMTVRGLTYTLVQWLMDRGYMSDADGPLAMRQIEDLISDYLEEALQKIVKEAQQARDAKATEFR